MPEVGKASEIADGQMRAADLEGERVTIANVGGTYYAFEEACSHVGCSLTEGTLEGTAVVCPCHGSRFDIATGAVLQGPARRPVKHYQVQVNGDNLSI